MIIDVLTLFPGMFRGFLESSIVRKAIEAKAINVYLTDIRDFAFNKHRQTDDYPYGGEAGMVMKPEPVYEALRFLDMEDGCPVIYFTPQGRKLDQEVVREYASVQRMVLLCGHYKEIDQRIRDKFVTDEISLGDYIISGGELASMIMIDAVARLQDGVLNDIASAQSDSFEDGELDCPYYTRPEVFLDMAVPDVLLSGDHKKIQKWRREQAKELTRKRRPDLMKS
ncbi:MAG TPA: tRNA (guanosine(37)-N1)-methyltransferase TrmD [Candidatus Cloacimonadota bacterium]|nr:tRNA (guanosine(37)-N1)-methyltransferase TrmD [Candidatus Cloacimonadota bacterium]HPT71336.1 tRNA (guanosine(37)-N1)-methyltransferase TrmD [Candidatus Cloacimonadota bacterium]